LIDNQSGCGGGRRLGGSCQNPVAYFRPLGDLDERLAVYSLELVCQWWKLLGVALKLSPQDLETPH